MCVQEKGNLLQRYRVVDEFDFGEMEVVRYVQNIVFGKGFQ